MIVNPEPISRDDGGTDFRVSSCPVACYSVNSQGMSVEKCPFLAVQCGATETTLQCTDKDSC
jgi:hypothetical protein